MVGAGIAGLACARDLRRGGCVVTVVEGRDRIGGRIHTTSDCVDLGASWIHGEVGNPLVSDFPGIVTMPSPYDREHIVVYDETGKVVDKKQYAQSEAAFNKALDITLEKKREKMRKDKPLRSSLLKIAGPINPVLHGQILALQSLMGADLEALSTWVRPLGSFCSFLSNNSSIGMTTMETKVWTDIFLVASSRL